MASEKPVNSDLCVNCFIRPFIIEHLRFCQIADCRGCASTRSFWDKLFACPEHSQQSEQKIDLAKQFPMLLDDFLHLLDTSGILETKAEVWPLLFELEETEMLNHLSKFENIYEWHRLSAFRREHSEKLRRFDSGDSSVLDQRDFLELVVTQMTREIREKYYAEMGETNPHPYCTYFMITLQDAFNEYLSEFFKVRD
jgi:hypothetical protein